KRSKFVHYAPQVLVINNLEFDHADIFDDVQAIERQFHHLVRTVPGRGLIVHAHGDPHIDATLKMGCWTPCETFGLDQGRWQIRNATVDASRFDVAVDGRIVGRVEYALLGLHNARNALAAIAAAAAVGVPTADACAWLSDFRNVRRRLELRANVNDIKVYDDFAHHPTAVTATLGALRAAVGEARILAVLDPASNTMRMGIHRDTLADSLADADHVILHRSKRLCWDPAALLSTLGERARVFDEVDQIVEHLCTRLQPGDHVLIMSNGSFDGIHDKLLAALRAG
ncbi:MAG: UDP-N-acetylmuramate:L-alanyl-gamma-D-glutamyl-meso-diaminopimelate ligase, partial [Gammaproteobacteria bacterium]|nr:UDP-N-acetylmuramate:L-alanyl-gamma-D-glutamyl-meso-diaminopimelate ligase [Gammaproteobacteria bacterium]